MCWKNSSRRKLVVSDGLPVANLTSTPSGGQHGCTLLLSVMLLGLGNIGLAVLGRQANDATLI
jgi:hypothetical protein